MNQPSYESRRVWRYTVAGCLGVIAAVTGNTPAHPCRAGSESHVLPAKSNVVPTNVHISATINNRGMVVTINDVLFATASAELSPAAIRNLADLAELLTLLTEHAVLLEGHTDNIGSDEQNFRLSRERAVAVKAYLVERGIDPVRLQTEGVGESDPVASNATAIGRRQNRNVAVIVSD